MKGKLSHTILYLKYSNKPIRMQQKSVKLH